MKKIFTLFLLFMSVAGITQNGFTTYSCTLAIPGIQNQYRSSVAVDNAGAVWIGFKGSTVKLIKFDNGTWTDHSSGITAPVNSLSVDATGLLWLGTSNGLGKYDGSNFTLYNTSNSAIISDNIISVTCTGNNVYAGSTNGFSIFDGASFANYSTTNSGLSSNSIYCFEQENTNTWIGTGHGLHLLNNGIITYVGDTNLVYDIMIDPTGNKWLGTEASGLLKYDNISFVSTESLLPLIVGGKLPKRVVSIGTSVNNNPVINLQSASNSPAVKLSLLEVFPGDNYHVYPLNFPGNTVPYGECLFARNANELYFTDVKYSGGSWSTTHKFLHRFDQSLYNPAAEISSILPENTRFLDINNVSAGCNPNSDIHWDGSKSLYELPKGSGKHPTFMDAFWMGGYVNGQLRMAANTYRQSGVDFWPGPINTASGTTDTATAMLYNKVWKVNRFDVENFKFNFLNGAVQNGTYIVPADILSWPGNGTIAGETLAPYFDYNGDGYYNAMAGDYPLIKGDQMLWWVFNDALSNHMETGSLAGMNVQIAASAYAYTCPTVADSDKIINNTTFYNYRITNKSTNFIDSVYVAIESDADLGYYNDDYVGCDVQNNFAFIYNGDSFDENGNGVNGYGSNTPYFSYNVLKGPTADPNDGLDNDKDGCTDCTFQLDANGNPTIVIIDDDVQPESTSMNTFFYFNNTGDNRTGNPTTNGNGNQYYRYLNAQWKDGTPWRYDNGNGTSNSGMPCYFLYPGDSDPYGYGVGGSASAPITTTAWSEINSTTNNQTGDRRFMSSAGKFTMQPGETKEFDFAYVFTQDSAALANGVLYNKVVSDNKKIKKWFQQNNAPSCLDLSSVGLKGSNPDMQILVYPNPATHLLTIDAGMNNTINTIKVYDILGKELLQKTDIATSQTLLNIATFNSGIYLLEVQSEKGYYFKKFIKQ